MSEDPKEIGSAKIVLDELDPTLHEPVRLGILILLHLHSSLPFSIIQKSLDVTSGNLNTHLARLDKEHLVVQEKMFVNVRPRTVVYITDDGRKALKKYTNSLRQILCGIGEL